MNRVCVVTSDPAAYFALVSMLRKAGLQFDSVLPGSTPRGCELVLTTSDEARNLGQKHLVLEELDRDPDVFKGQVISAFGAENDDVLVGVDPGVRTGLAVYYGRAPLAFGTFGSHEALCAKVGAFARRLPRSRFVLRIGNGSPGVTAQLVKHLKEAAPGAMVEIVDEKGTSARTPDMKGIQGDQRAASKIAFRKGAIVGPGRTRTHG